ncbi:transcription factor SPT20 homolog [Eupeodes corollae]|uniref:transcription factor SPT20 homolog n=1 Tax=Eupeodes corollae TaxID=290404 RepID=UPI0024937EAA|nr:transcription factor SPT20 homolog [Eupeodes corollae]
MDNFALKRKRLIFCVIVLTALGINGTKPLNDNSTQLKQFIAPNNKTGLNENNNNDHQLRNDDISAQESVKIENRQLYDTVKHASGYDPDVNNNNNNSHNTSNKEILEKQNNNVSYPTTTIRIHPRKSAVIQAIPRKVRGPGGNTNSATTSDGSYLKLPTNLPPTIKDYGSGEPTTTIVYATSIPTSMPPSRTFVNIRPVPLLSSQKYRSTIVVENERSNHKNVENTKPVLENQQYSDQEEEEEQQQQNQLNDAGRLQDQKLLVLRKSTKDDLNSMQSTTTPRNQDAAVPYQTEQQKRNPYKSILYSRIGSNNAEINDEQSYNNRHSYYLNHKWSDDDYMRGSQAPPVPLAPASSHFVYENPDPQRSFNHLPLSPQTRPNAFLEHQTSTQNFIRPRYMGSEGYQRDMNSVVYDPMAQEPTMLGLLTQQNLQRQQKQQHQQQQYQPLTVRDFDLLLQLLVLREQRMHDDPFLSSSSTSPIGINCRNNQQENSYFYPLPKGSTPHVQEYPSSHFRNHEPTKILENSSLRNQQQQPLTKLLPSNVREELLFRMLLLALHLQLQPQPLTHPQQRPLSKITNILPEHQHQRSMYIGSPSISSASDLSPYPEFRHSYPSASPKNAVRSVQVLGEID